MIRKIVTLTMVCIIVLGFILILKVDIRTGKLRKAHLLYGSVENSMVPIKAYGQALYLFKSQRKGILKPIPDNVHDLIFFSINIDDLESTDVAIVTYNPLYPFWAGAKPVFHNVDYKSLKCVWDENEYEGYRSNIKCMIMGDGLFSKHYCDYELWYKPRN